MSKSAAVSLLNKAALLRLTSKKKKKIFGKGYSDCTTFWPLLPCLEAEADLERKVTIKVLRLLPLAAAASEATILDIGWRKSH